jgi:flavin reductase (DIM6/NTAB) family NADH-FMN oxidoreductase RutF
VSIGEPRNLDPLRLLAYALAPRPVVLVVTLSAEGVLNIAPFSMVTPLSAEPPLLGLGVSPRRDGGVKATLRNLLDTGEFVVNTVGEVLLPAAVAASFDDGPPPAGRFPTLSSEAVRPPRLVGAVAQLECRLAEVFRPRGSGTRLVIGEVVRLHFGDTLLPNETGSPAEALPGHLAMEAPGIHWFRVGGRLLKVTAQGGPADARRDE